MLNRRHIRIKVLQSLYSYFKISEKDSTNSKKNFNNSLKNIENLYLCLFVYVLGLRDYIENFLENAKFKKLPSAQDLNPNTKFVDNRFLKLLQSLPSVKKAINDFSFLNNNALYSDIYIDLLKLDDYQNYLNFKTDDFEQDKLFLIKIFSKFLIEHEHFHYLLNEQNIFWDDDLPFISSMVVKTIKDSDSEKIKLMKLFKDKDDKKFSLELYEKTINNKEYYIDLISSKINNWEIERVAEIDLLLMQMSLTEILEINDIPVKVTINEYIEISKYYSTQKSKSFINGILDSLLLDLRNEGKINKTGRGLIE